jgi:hypothetical protein
MHAWNPHQSGRKKRFRSVLILWQTTRDEQRYLAGSVRVHVRKHSYNITGAWADLKISIHSDRTTTHAKKADAIDLIIRETERDKAAPREFFLRPPSASGCSEHSAACSVALHSRNSKDPTLWSNRRRLTFRDKAASLCLDASHSSPRSLCIRYSV